MGPLLVRADADGRQGTGHVMRCLALARAWRDCGGRPAFVTCCPVERLRQRIRTAGSELVPLDRPHDDPADLSATLDVLGRLQAETAEGQGVWTVLDGYYFDSAYRRAIRAAGGRVLAVDDLVRPSHHHADLLLNPNAGAELLECACDPDTTLLLGTRYALLRPEFMRWEAWRREVPHTARRILVTFGGADPQNATAAVLQALGQIDVPSWEAKVVLGAANPHCDWLRRQLRRLPGRIELLLDPSDMPELMAWADVAVSAAGSTCWELAWMRLPAVVLTAADNQQPIARQLSATGAAAGLGWFERPTVEEIAEAISTLCRDRDRRLCYSRLGRRLVDGGGARRVVAVMRALSGALPAGQLRLRRAAAHDLMPLWRLKNDPAVRRVSLVSSDPVPLEEHTAWFNRRLSSPDTLIWVWEFQGLVVAVIRYDRTLPGTAEISLSVAAAFRRRGLAGRLLRETAASVRRELHVDCLRAIVRRENVPSAGTFAKAGFVKVDSRPVKSRECHIFEQGL